jgi:hypothetical protein
MKPPKNRDLVKGALYHIIFDDSEEVVLLFKGFNIPDQDKLIKLFSWKEWAIQWLVPNWLCKRDQIFEVVLMTDWIHDLIQRPQSEVTPKWDTVRAYERIDIKELPLYLHLPIKYPAFERLLKEGL